MFRDGLGVPKDQNRALSLFQAAAGQDLAEAQVNLGKFHLGELHFPNQGLQRLTAERGEIQAAFGYFEAAIRNGSPFEAFHLIASIYATTARLPSHAAEQRANCGVGVAYFKIVAERGSWQDDFIAEGDKAWARGEEDVAMVKWLVAAEMGSEVAQNNIAFILESGKGGHLFNGSTESLALRQWVRSAAQDNVDAMVKVGDLYCESHSGSF